jgi:flagellar hook protein FlgE
MSLYAALFSGVSGLNAYSSAMGVISDNITNVNTVGYKAAEAQFSTLVTDSRSLGTYTPGGVRQVTRALISQQGLLQATNSGTDLSVDGAGFFVVRTRPETGGGEVQFTRAGSFRPDADGYLKNSAGLYLQGWALDSTGAFTNNGDVADLVAINIAQLSGTAEATTQIRLRANLQSTETVFAGAYATGDLAAGTTTPHFERSVDVFDAQGGSHSVTLSFLKTGANQWAVEVHADPTEVTAAGGLLTAGMLQFNADGSLNVAGSSASLFSPLAVSWTNGAGSSPIDLALGSDGSVDGLTQFDSASALISRSVDGAVFGNVTGVEINEDGLVTALFDNGLTRAVYQLPLATFQNPDGLLRLQGNAYGVSDFSGTYALVTPETGGGGRISPSTLEASTVDLAREFTNMITVQRAYSASTRIISTADEMLAELSNLRR